VQESLKPMVLEMDERTTDDNMWQKLNLTLLMKTRSEQWQTRLAVLSVIDHLFEKMRERYLVILNDTIPFISELLEDENEQVELAAKTIVNRIEQLTGESINEYLK
jgi:U3 small nucleolar RNA-associated protein 10